VKDDSAEANEFLHPDKDGMDTTYILKKLVVIAIWIWVGYLFIPAAKAKNRSRILWYFAGLASFYLPFLGTVIVCGVMVKAVDTIYSLSPQRQLTLLVGAIPVGLAAGTHFMYRLRRKLRSLHGKT